MEAIEVGFLSILPPLIAIVLALLTKEVIPSLVVGILSGTFIYSLNTGGGLIGTVETSVELMAVKLSDNITMILFLAFLGCLVAVITMAGGSQAYGKWAASKIKSRTGAKLSTAFLGLIIFIDDYFNCLTVGTVMQPVTDKYKVSRAKLAYIIDSTAAPICIIAPISSWAASVISQIEDSGAGNGLSIFIKSIPYNLYALFTILMVIVVCCTSLDFGPMKKFELAALDSTDNFKDESIQETEISNMDVSSKGTVLDLILPIVSLISLSVITMLYIGGYFDGGVSLSDAFGDTDPGLALAISGFLSLFISFLLFVPRKVLSFKRFMDGLTLGVKSMVPAFIILTLAWTISGVCRDLLSTGTYVGDFVSSSNFKPEFIPAIVFLVAGFLAFAMGTSWGTFGILIPIITIISQEVAPELLTISIAAVLAGSVFGDHCSPISDTTILSSTGAGCKHLDHVSSQIPYTLVVAGACFIGYLVAGFTQNIILTLLVTLVSLTVFAFMVKKFLCNNKSV
ncbi:MAG: Na+/H+ antiporter NhaC family protein [Oscillospiraceae bacterium]